MNTAAFPVKALTNPQLQMKLERICNLLEVSLNSMDRNPDFKKAPEISVLQIALTELEEVEGVYFELSKIDIAENMREIEEQEISKNKAVQS